MYVILRIEQKKSYKMSLHKQTLLYMSKSSTLTISEEIRYGFVNC